MIRLLGIPSKLIVPKPNQKTVPMSVFFQLFSDFQLFCVISSDIACIKPNSSNRVFCCFSGNIGFYAWNESFSKFFGPTGEAFGFASSRQYQGRFDYDSQRTRKHIGETDLSQTNFEFAVHFWIESQRLVEGRLPANSSQWSERSVERETSPAWWCVFEQLRLELV